MNVILGKTSGFCAGVRYTIAKAEEELAKTDETIDCLGEIIHNKQVIQNLEQKGLRIINSIEDAKSNLIIRAHGTTKATYETAKLKNINLIDLTCPKVLKIHNQVETYTNNNYFVLLIGCKKHPEIIGTASFCNENSYIIETEKDIPTAITAIKSSSLKNILVISQTTYSVNQFNALSNMILNLLDNSYNIHIENSICNATNLRQAEAKEIASKVELMIIIGGKNSSNTRKLYEVSKNNCKNAIHIESIDELDLNYVKQFENVGIMAGASTPDYVINEVYNVLVA